MENSLKNTLRNVIRDKLLTWTDFTASSAQTVADQLVIPVMATIKNWTVDPVEEKVKTVNVNLNIGSSYKPVFRSFDEIDRAMRAESKEVPAFMKEFMAHWEERFARLISKVEPVKEENNKINSESGYYWTKLKKESPWAIAWLDADKQMWGYVCGTGDISYFCKNGQLYAVQNTKIEMAEPLKEEKPERETGYYWIQWKKDCKIIPAWYEGILKKWTIVNDQRSYSTEQLYAVDDILIYNLITPRTDFDNIK